MIPLEVRDLIDAAVHTAIYDAFHRYPDGLESRCAHYAIVGSKCLSRLTGESHIPVCGSQLIPVVSGGFYAIAPPPAAIEGADELSDLRNYHCWIEAAHGESVDVIDFTLRHNLAACQLLGIPLAQSTEEPYAWVTMPKALCGQCVPEKRFAYTSCLARDAQLTNLLWEFQFENNRVFDVLSDKALQIVSDALQSFLTDAVET